MSHQLFCTLNWTTHFRLVVLMLVICLYHLVNHLLGAMLKRHPLATTISPITISALSCLALITLFSPKTKHVHIICLRNVDASEMWKCHISAADEIHMIHRRREEREKKEKVLECICLLKV